MSKYDTIDMDASKIKLIVKKSSHLLKKINQSVYLTRIAVVDDEAEVEGCRVWPIESFKSYF